jgi:hypothetical protein
VTEIGRHLVNHFGLVLDASTSMERHAKALVKAADSQVQYLARRSKELGQETRISVWTFSGETDYGWGSRARITPESAIKNIVWDMDVLRLPSIAEFYQPYGNTAMIDGTLKAIEDLSETPQRYGDHSFLLYVMTDGEENRSRRSYLELREKLSKLPENWTVGALVPDLNSEHEAKRFGFPAGNIARWNATSDTGTEEAGASILRATDSYMTSRASGVRGTKTLFDTSSASLNSTTVSASGMKELDPSTYILHFIPPVTSPFPKALSRRAKYRIDEYVHNILGLPFVVGRNYYELIKTETIGANKDIAIVERNKGKGGKVYLGREARDLIGLPDRAGVRVKPDFNDEFWIFVRSDSTNRNMLEGQRLLVLR